MESTKKIINQFHELNVPVIQLDSVTKAPIWNKWQETTVEMSKANIDYSKTSNFSIRTGPIDENTTVFALDFDMFNKTTETQDDSIGKKRTELLGTEYNGMYKSGTCGNTVTLVHSAVPEINDLLKSIPQNKIVWKGKADGDIEILKGRGCQVVIPPSSTICKRHKKICKKRKFTNPDFPVLHLTNDVEDEDNVYRVDTIATFIQDTIDQKKENDAKKVKTNHVFETTDGPTSKLDICIDMLKLLEPKMCENNDSWLEIGMSLKSGFGENGWTAFDDWSKQSITNYDEANNRTRWDSFKSGKTTIRTLKYHAEKNIKGYQDLIRKHLQPINEFFKKIKSASINDCAKLFYENLGKDTGKFVYSSKDDIFYHYNKHNTIEKHDTKNNPILLSQTITDVLDRLNDEQFNNLKFLVNENDKEYKWIQKESDKFHVNCGCPSYKKKIIEELRQYISSYTFSDKIDTTEHIVPYKDQCFDSKLNCFRPIEKSDFVSKNAGYNKPSPNLKVQKEIMDIVKGLIQFNIKKPSADEKEMTKFLLDTLGFSLITNKFEKLYIWTGSGGNGKGVLARLLQNALGGLYFPADSKFLTGTVKSGAADPILFDCKGHKIIMNSEPESKNDDPNVSFNVGKLKGLTGRDRQTCRTLNGKPVTWDVLFNLILQCNQIPDFEKIDDALLRRICIIQFIFSFVVKPAKNSTTEKQINYECKTMFNNPVYYQQFLLMLIEHIRGKVNEVLVIPKAVKQHTLEFLNENNTVKIFIDENYEVGAKDDYVKLQELYKRFNYSADKKMSKKDFKYSMKTNKHIFKERITIDGKQKRIAGYQYLKLKTLVFEDETSNKNLTPVNNMGFVVDNL